MPDDLPVNPYQVGLFRHARQPRADLSLESEAIISIDS
jgi:hypothetical protein